MNRSRDSSREATKSRVSTASRSPGCGYEPANGARPESEIEFVEGLQHGAARDWYPTGQLRGRTEYLKGVRHGREEEWFETGAKAMRASWEYDILVEKTVWTPSGHEVEHYRLREDDPLFATLTALRKAAARR